MLRINIKYTSKGIIEIQIENIVFLKQKYLLLLYSLKRKSIEYILSL